MCGPTTLMRVGAKKEKWVQPRTRVSAPLSRTGPTTSLMEVSTSSPLVWPLSTISTQSGHAAVTTSTSDACLETTVSNNSPWNVAVVANTPMTPLALAMAAIEREDAKDEARNKVETQD